MLQPKQDQVPQGAQGPHPRPREERHRRSPSAQYGLKALEPERVTARQIEAARRAITRHMKRAGRVWIRVFPDVPVSKKPLEVRMGSGKGASILGRARQARPHPVRDRRRRRCDSPRKRSRSRAAKLPIKTRFVAAHRGVGEETDDESRRRPGDDARPARDELLKLKKEQFNLRFQRATGQLENTGRVRAGAPRHRARSRRSPRRSARPTKAK